MATVTQVNQVTPNFCWHIPKLQVTIRMAVDTDPAISAKEG
jgi:hypothetical protein